jgi:hypothetical protein
VLFDYAKLRGKIREICETQEVFSNLMGMSKATFSAKINNKSEFTQPEIVRAIGILHLRTDEISSYFFTPVVQKSEPIKTFETEKPKEGT